MTENFHPNEAEDVQKTWNTSIEEQTRLLKDIQKTRQTAAALEQRTTTAVDAGHAPASTQHQQSRVVEFASSDETRRFSGTSRSSRWEQFSTRHEETSTDFSSSLTTSDNAGILTKTVRRAKSASAKKSKKSSIVDRILTGADSRHHGVSQSSVSDDDDTSMPDLLPFSNDRRPKNVSAVPAVMKPTRNSEKRSRIDSSSLVDQYIGCRQPPSLPPQQPAPVAYTRSDSSERGSLVRRRSSVKRRPEEVLLRGSQGNLRRQESMTNLIRFDSYETMNSSSGHDLVFGQKQISTTNPEMSRDRRRSQDQCLIEKSGSQGNLLRRQESITNLSNYLQADLNRKWSIDAKIGAGGDDLVFGQSQVAMNGELRRDRRIEQSNSQGNLRRQDSMSNLSNLQDDINSLLRDAATVSTISNSNSSRTVVETTSNSLTSYPSGRSNYQAIASSLLSEPGPR